MNSEQEKHIRKQVRDPRLTRSKRTRKADIIITSKAVAARNRQHRLDRSDKRKARAQQAKAISLELDEWPGYKRKEGEKTPSSMKVEERRSFVKDLVHRYQARLAEDGSESEEVDDDKLIAKRIKSDGHLLGEQWKRECRRHVWALNSIKSSHDPKWGLPTPYIVVNADVYLSHGMLNLRNPTVARG